MKQVKFITGLMAFGVVSLFAGCGEKENEMTKVTLNEVAHSIFYAPQYVALENGYFTQEGLCRIPAQRRNSFIQRTGRHEIPYP